MKVSCRSVLMEHLKACMQQGIATSTTTIGAFYNTNLSIVEECATIPLRIFFIIILGIRDQ